MTDAAKLAAHRSLTQHTSALNRASRQIAEDLHAFSQHWQDAKAALRKIEAVTGGGEGYPGAEVPALRWLIEQEISRIGCVTAQHGLVPDLPGARVPPGGYIDDRSEPLQEEVARMTRWWLEVHKRALADG